MSEARGKRIGLTGGIGAGKSTATAYFRKLGVCILDADEGARKVVEPNCPGLIALYKRYGANILHSDGSLNRGALADIIFRSDKERAAVNAILHPLIKQWMLQSEEAYSSEYPGYPVIWDVPLLIETGLHTLMDIIWVIAADSEQRIERIVARDGCTREQAEARIASQMPLSEQVRYASVVIYNNETEDIFIRQLHACFKQALE